MNREVTRLTPGTQVVLRAGTQLPAEGQAATRKPGYIGEITQVLEGTDEPYIVRFSDGAVFTLPRRQLIVRRTLMTAELDMLAPDYVNWTDYVFYRVRVGARAYGLDDADTEEDAIRGVYLPPATLHWSLYKPLEQIELQRPSPTSGAPIEEVYWEVEKFVRLGLAANPAVLEALYTPAVMATSDLGRDLRSIRDAFPSKLLFTTFTGYVMSQFRKMMRARDRGELPQPRHTMHLVRLLLSGLSAARTGEMDVTAQEHATELVAIRTGRMSFEETYNWATTLQRQFEALMTHSPLPDLPDYATANDFLVRVRSQSVAIAAPHAIPD
ncbi:MAG: nucleotidyltransferase domain-containing protein [Ktedonobacterales bacterium]|nr:nucleotidyltransferase domain-containing protein [Ktedonobacterales bacterium]